MDKKEPWRNNRRTMKVFAARKNLTKEQLTKLDYECAERNLRVGRYMTIVMSILEIMMIVYGLFSFTFSKPRHIAYFTLYCILLGVSIIVFLCSEFVIRKKIINVKFVNLVIYIYLFIILLWGMGISLLDMVAGSQSTAFLTALIGSTCILLLSPKPLLPTILISVALFFCVAFITDTVTSSGLIINVLMFALMVFVIGTRRYNDFVSDFVRREEVVDINTKLNNISKHDELTGLLNRSAMNDDLQKVLDKCILNKRQLSVFMFDIDDFKNINDTLGHKVGDECLKAVAAEMKKTLTHGELYRYGGEEFSIVFDDVDIENAIAIGERLIKQVAQLKLAKLQYRAITISGGLYSAEPNPTDNTDTYLIRADRKLYESKNNGKNRLSY